MTNSGSKIGSSNLKRLKFWTKIKIVEQNLNFGPKPLFTTLYLQL